MLKVLQMSLVRRLALLAIMLTGLAGLTLENSGAVKANSNIICCSACEGENPPPPCRHGCSPSC